MWLTPQAIIEPLFLEKAPNTRFLIGHVYPSCIFGQAQGPVPTIASYLSRLPSHLSRLSVGVHAFYGNPNLPLRKFLASLFTGVQQYKNPIRADGNSSRFVLPTQGECRKKSADRPRRGWRGDLANARIRAAD